MLFCCPTFSTNTVAMNLFYFFIFFLLYIILPNAQSSCFAVFTESVLLVTGNDKILQESQRWFIASIQWPESGCSHMPTGTPIPSASANASRGLVISQSQYLEMYQRLWGWLFVSHPFFPYSKTDWLTDSKTGKGRKTECHHNASFCFVFIFLSGIAGRAILFIYWQLGELQ